MRIWPYGFGDGSVKLAHGPNRVRGNLAAIQGSGEDKCSNNSLLVLIVPTEVAEPAGNGGATVDAVVERAPKKPGPCRDVCTKVSKMQYDLDTNVDDRPIMSSKPGPSGATS